MSSDLFRVEVVKKSKACVDLDVTDTCHEIEAPETLAFFFALWESAQGTEHPLATACTSDEMCNEAFIEKNASTYVASVEVLSAVSPARATYRVSCTDPRWCAHLRRGKAWGSVGYDLGEPVLHEALVAAAPRPPTPVRRGATLKG